MIGPPRRWNVIYNAWNNRRRPPTSPNIAPATKNDSHDWSSSQMNRHLHCGATGVTLQLCACHEKWHAKIWGKCAETVEAPFTMAEDANPIRTQTRHLAPARSPRLLFALRRRIVHWKLQRFGYLSIFHQILRLPRKVTLQHHQMLCLPQKMTLQQYQILHLPRKVRCEWWEWCVDRCEWWVSYSPLSYSTLSYSTLSYWATELLYWTVTWLNCSLTEVLLDWTVPWLNCSLTKVLLDWAVPCLNCSLTELLLDWTVSWLNCSLTEVLLDWTVPWLNCSLTEVFLDWTGTWLNCRLTELFLDWSVTWLNCSLTELFLDWTVPWLKCYLTELFLAWTVPWLNWYLTELLLYWTVTWLNSYFTKVLLFWTLFMFKSPWLGSFSTKLPLIVYCIPHSIYVALYDIAHIHKIPVYNVTFFPTMWY